MDDERFDALAKKSRTVHGLQDVLPVACWLIEARQSSVRAPELIRGLDGRRQSVQILKALARLEEIGAVSELPRLSSPNARHFEVVANHQYWPFAEATVAEIDRELADVR